MAATSSLCVSQLTVSRRPSATAAQLSSPSTYSSHATVSVPSAFFAPGLHASCSSVVFREGRDLLALNPRAVQRRRQGDLVVRGLFGLGVPELAVIAGVVALVFGPKKLPEIGKSLGKTVKSFSQAAKEFESEIKSSANEFQAELKGPKADTSLVESPKVESPGTAAATTTTTTTNTSASEKDTA